MADDSIGGTPRPRISRAFDDRSRGLDRFGVVLALTVVSVVGLSLFDISSQNTRLGRDVGSLAAAVLVGATLAMALRASGLARRRQRVIDVLIGGVVLVYALTIVVEKATGELPGSAAGVSSVIVSLSVVAPVVVVLRLLRHREVTGATLLGAISAYLLIGLAFFWLFFAIGNDRSFFTTSPQPSQSYMYFSLTTLTTVGYGDLTAQGNLGRLLATSEALIGQVYLVTFVAMIVGLRVASWRREPEASAGGAATATPSGDEHDEGPSPR